MEFSVQAPNQVTILRKIRGNSPESFLGIRGNSQESFTGKSSENVDSYSEEFLVTRISKESVTGNNSREIPWKFFKESHYDWRIWGNSSLLFLV